MVFAMDGTVTGEASASFDEVVPEKTVPQKTAPQKTAQDSEPTPEPALEPLPAARSAPIDSAPIEAVPVEAVPVNVVPIDGVPLAAVPADVTGQQCEIDQS